MTHDTRYDPFSDDVLADPFPVYEELRKTCPVHYYPDFGAEGFYTLSRHRDVVDLCTDLDSWSADYGQAPIYVKEGGLRSDPPEHNVYRRLITSFFTSKKVSALESAVRGMAAELIDGFARRGGGDLVELFAGPLPALVISSILGVPRERQAEFREWTDEFMAGQNDGDPGRQASARGKIDEYFAAELSTRRRTLAESRAADPMTVLPDDVLTSLLLANRPDGEPFTDEQLLPLLLLLLVGGIETTTSLIASLVLRMLDMGLWGGLRGRGETGEALASAVEETLRMDPPVLGLFRTAKGDQELHGSRVPDEAKVHGLFASANRDATVWSRPDEFRLDRLPQEARKHLSFGVGIWLCPGAALARLEATVSAEELEKRLPGLQRNGPAERKGSFMMWGPATLPVTWQVPTGA
jgi:cytochrome P450